MNHIVHSTTVYHVLLFLFPFQNANMLTCLLCLVKNDATLNLTLTYLTFNQLLWCLSKYVKFFPFIIFFPALFRSCFFFSLYPSWYSFASSLWLSLSSLFWPFLFSFVLAYQSFNLCSIFWSLNGKILRILLEFFKPHSDLHILHFVC